ncbi:MAG: hypothetical protein GF344_00370 [Chitinivibrionales bacterium]|nr:hypothetical protein [Chitinivibrionales bacterium]MBD3355581.1 hypothetical protein [Chitinivibrionales bacterium]
MHRDSIHNIYAHYGIRTHRHKLNYYYNQAFGLEGRTGGGESTHWELFDLEKDSRELQNV